MYLNSLCFITRKYLCKASFLFASNCVFALATVCDDEDDEDDDAAKAVLGAGDLDNNGDVAFGTLGDTDVGFFSEFSMFT